MLELWDGFQEPDCNGKGPSCMVEFRNKIGDIDSTAVFSGLQDLLHPKSVK